MQSTEQQQLAAWARQWRQAGPALEQIRREELRRVDTVRALTGLLGLFQSACWTHAARPDSGLVEQQKWFRKIAPPIR
ncbi:MAG TPA: hypothetical protein PKE12_06975 [Kiritimatiellia bacterium]|nr:hypothetical protein [Kiritimatiellia bacterium]